MNKTTGKNLTVKRKQQLMSIMRSNAETDSGGVHIVFGKSGWAVKKERSKRASFIEPTKLEAIERAKAIPGRTRVIVHKKDGSIEKHISLKSA